MAQSPSSWLTLLASHQSLMLGAMSTVICLLAVLWIFQKRLKYASQLHKAFRFIGWCLGAYMTYAAILLGYTGDADPLTIILLFLGGAIGMHLQKHIPWAWLVAPILAGFGVLQLWDVLLADPSWQVTLGSIAALSLPTFILLTYFERAHQSLGEVLTTTRLALVVASVMMLQAVTLWAGISLWGIVQTGLTNIIEKLTVLLGGMT